MKRFAPFCASLLIAAAAGAAAPSFRGTAEPEGWTLIRGQVAPGPAWQAAQGGTALARTIEPLALPIEATFRFLLPAGGEVTIGAVEGTNAPPPPLLHAQVRFAGPNQVRVRAQAAGAPMATDTISTRTWSQVDRTSGWLTYAWRFPRVRNLWDDRDRREIGAAFEELTPFDEKPFTLRLVLTSDSRQIWLDDRLVAETRMPAPDLVHFSMQVAGPAQLAAADFRAPAAAAEPYLPLPLGAYSHARSARAAEPARELVSLPGGIPMWMPDASMPPVDLGQSLFRYRLSHGSGPDVGYVNALATWPAAFRVDPATLAFRVPYRHYRTAWLLVYLDDQPGSVPGGALRVFPSS